MVCGCLGDCAEFFAKHLRSEVHKQLRLRQPPQPSDTKSSSSSLVTLSASLSTDCSVPAPLMLMFPPSSHDSSLPSPSDLLAQLKVTDVIDKFARSFACSLEYQKSRCFQFVIEEDPCVHKSSKYLTNTLYPSCVYYQDNAI